MIRKGSGPIKLSEMMVSAALSRNAAGEFKPSATRGLSSHSAHRAQRERLQISASFFELSTGRD